MPISEDSLRASLAHCGAVNDGAPITFFEITTAAAFHAFRCEPSDVLVLEVGLGGRLDATNVIERPALTVIAPVSIDHTHYLGETLELIAAEKAGILKRGATGVIGRQHAEAGAVIERVAADAGAPLARLDREWSFDRSASRLVVQDARGEGALPAAPVSPARIRWKTRRLRQSAPGCSPASMWEAPQSPRDSCRRAGRAGFSA